MTHDQNLTTSLLHFTPKISDQGKVISCIADNGVFPSVNRSVELNVYYVPVVHTEITNDIDPSNIREGDEIEMECKIQAHPWVWRILWYRDGTELKSTKTAEAAAMDGGGGGGGGDGSSVVVIDEQRLKLSNVSKSLSGQYVCSASNVEGDGFSKPLRVAVKYKPVCVAPAIEYKNHSQGIGLRYRSINKSTSKH